MKWAPNKKLHLEVAVIKAIQTLSQVTLNEVIENLAALRDGSAKGGESEASSARPKISTAISPVARAKLTEPAVAEKPINDAMKIAENPGEEVPIDFEAAWQGVIAATRARRPLIRTWIEQARPLGVEGRFFLLGFPPEQRNVMESLARPANREFLEALLKEETGREWSLKLCVKEGLVASPPPSPPEDELAPAQPAKKAGGRAAFKDDPLIREALEIFKGEIKPVTD
jgi:DNA polymerase-3 subunit gamma/tau